MANVILRKADQYATCDPVKLSAEYTGQILDQDLVMDMDVLENGQCVVVKHNAIKAPATATDKVACCRAATKNGWMVRYPRFFAYLCCWSSSATASARWYRSTPTCTTARARLM